MKNENGLAHLQALPSEKEQVITIRLLQIKQDRLTVLVQSHDGLF